MNEMSHAHTQVQPQIPRQTAGCWTRGSWRGCLGTSLARLVGDLEEVSLELRFLNGISLMSAATTLTMITVNLLLVDDSWLDVTLSGVAFVVATTVYWASRFRGWGDSLRWPFFAGLFFLACASWFSNEGLMGSAPHLFFPILVGGVVLLPRRWRQLTVGSAIAIVAALVVVHRAKPGWLLHYGSAEHRLFDVSVYLMICFVVVAAFILTLHREYERERCRGADLYRRAEAENRNLQEALTKIRVLEGLLPICTRCKSIQDQAGKWCELEDYLADRSQVLFSHGICGQCRQDYYAEFLGDEEERVELPR